MARFHRISELNEAGERVIRVVQFTPEEEARADAWEARVIPTPAPTRLDLLEQRIEALERKPTQVGGPK